MFLCNFFAGDACVLSRVFLHGYSCELQYFRRSLSAGSTVSSVLAVQIKIPERNQKVHRYSDQQSRHFVLDPKSPTVLNWDLPEHLYRFCRFRQVKSRCFGVCLLNRSDEPARYGANIGSSMSSDFGFIFYAPQG